MRQGAAPQDACRRVVERIESLPVDTSDVQVGVLALSKTGEVGAYGLQPGFDTARYTPDAGNHLVEAEALHESD
jgi:isoaspartyl peptidase/L-asparaginase-like protein (Ntn-hydrolase superfamily)